MLTKGESEKEIHRDSLYYCCNLSINIRLFKSKKVFKNTIRFKINISTYLYSLDKDVLTKKKSVEKY